MYTTRNKNNIIYLRTNIIIIYTVLYTHVYSVQGHRITGRQKFRLNGYFFFLYINTHYLFIFFVLQFFFFFLINNPGASTKPHCMHSGRRPGVGPVQFIYIILQEKDDLFLKRSRLVDRTCYIVLYRYTKQ